MAITSRKYTEEPTRLVWLGIGHSRIEVVRAQVIQLGSGAGLPATFDFFEGIERLEPETRQFLAFFEEIDRN